MPNLSAKPAPTSLIKFAGGVLVWALKLGMLKNQPILTAYTEKLMGRPVSILHDEDQLWHQMTRNAACFAVTN